MKLQEITCYCLNTCAHLKIYSSAHASSYNCLHVITDLKLRYMIESAGVEKSKLISMTHIMTNRLFLFLDANTTKSVVIKNVY